MSKKPLDFKAIARWIASDIGIEADIAHNFDIMTMRQTVMAMVKMAAFPDKPDVHREYSEEGFIEIPRHVWLRLEKRLPDDIRAIIYAVNYEIEAQVKIPISVIVKETVTHYRVCPHQSGPMKKHVDFLRTDPMDANSKEH